MRPRLPLLAALTAATLIAAGCAATTQISLDPQLRQRLAKMGEIRAVHYNTSAAVVRARGDGVVARLNDGVLPVEAPVKAVKDRFLAVVNQELALMKLTIIDEPRQARISPLMAPPINLLRREFGRGLVFDFFAPMWELAPVYQPLWSTAPPRYALQFFVRARLVHLDDSTILWQQMCLRASGKQVRTPAEWLANNSAQLYADMDQAAQSCADELVVRFLGKK